MNWLRRLIPWAFRHDMDVDQRFTHWDHGKRIWRIRDTCRRCGFHGDYYEIGDSEKFERRKYKRGCRGAR